MNTFDRLRTKPEHERKKIALASTIAIFVGIMFVWGTLLWLKHDRDIANEVADSSVSPFQSLGAIFGEGLDGMKTSISSAKKALAPLTAPIVPTDENWQATIPAAPAEAGAAEEATASGFVVTPVTASNTPAVLP